MNALIKAAWLSVLASDAYKSSGNGRLVTPPTKPGQPTTYSSLGVLRELALAAGVQVEPTDDDAFRLPPAVAQWAEMSDLPWMRMAHPSGVHNLAHINTLGSGSFDLEAEAITKYL